jgi:GNAT superfamily N-acetyltransferase
MIKILAFLRESVTSLGAANGLLATFARSLDRASGSRCKLFKYYFVAQPVPARRSLVAGRPSKTRIYRASAENGIIRQAPRPPQNIAKRFADGAVCYVAEQANKLVGFIWIKQNSYHEDEVRCHYVLQPPTRLAWDFDAFVAPEFRMSRAFAQLWEAANEYLREHGYRWTISRISAFNAASLASHKRLGAVHLHTGVFMVLGPLQFSAFSCAPYVHIGFGSSSEPELTFHAPSESSQR